MANRQDALLQGRGDAFVAALKHLALPAIVLGTNMMGIITQLTRASVQEALHEDFVMTAHAKGLSAARVLWRHAFRNAQIGVVTIIGLEFGALLSGAMIVETVFAWPGIGSLLVQGISSRDYPLIIGLVLVYTTIFILVNLLIDLAYTVILSTDHLGRDILSRIIYGSRVSLIIAGAVAIFASVTGVALGVIAGWFGGRIDDAIQKLVEIFWSFPPLMLAIAIVAFVGQGLGIVIIALTAQRWIPYCRVTRAETMALREREFILSARTLGASDGFIIRHHILPNVMLSIIVMSSFAMANAIIAESALSFLGLGVPPAIPTWGGMLSDARSYISTAWWMALFPGVAIFLTVLGMNPLGDALRIQFDPQLKSR